MVQCLRRLPDKVRGPCFDGGYEPRDSTSNEPRQAPSQCGLWHRACPVGVESSRMLLKGLEPIAEHQQTSQLRRDPEYPIVQAVLQNDGVVCARDCAYIGATIPIRGQHISSSFNHVPPGRAGAGSRAPCACAPRAAGAASDETHPKVLHYALNCRPYPRTAMIPPDTADWLCQQVLSHTAGRGMTSDEWDASYLLSRLPESLTPSNSGPNSRAAPLQPGASLRHLASSRSAIVSATFRMRSCARAEKSRRRTAISGVRSSASSSTQSFPAAARVAGGAATATERGRLSQLRGQPDLRTRNPRAQLHLDSPSEVGQPARVRPVLVSHR